jgi:hypothetical protein
MFDDDGNQQDSMRRPRCGRTYVIFGDMNQQGSLSGPNCASSQNGRGGLFFVLQDQHLYDSVRRLLQGETAGIQPGEQGKD